MSVSNEVKSKSVRGNNRLLAMNAACEITVVKKAESQSRIIIYAAKIYS